MTKPVRVEASAERELEAAVRWYEDRVAGLGRRLLVALNSVVEHIRDFPETGAKVPRVVPEISVRRFPVHGFPYHVVYLETADTLWIVAFAHDRRRPNYWATRSKPFAH